MKNKLIYIMILICIVVIGSGCNNSNLQENNKKNINQSSEDSKEHDNNQDSIANDNNENKGKSQNEEVVPTNKTIVIDPGHSSTGTSAQEPIAPESSQTKLKDGLGATGEYTGVPEHKTNMSVALLLKENLESKGYNVVMTKSDVAESKSNIERAFIGNENNADLVLRIHADSSENNNIGGASVHVPGNNKYTSSIYEISKSYGETIINTYAQELGIKNRGVIERDDLTGFNWSKVPVVLIEMGFLSNKEDDMFVSNTENHSKIAKVIADGIYKCFE